MTNYKKIIISRDDSEKKITGYLVKNMSTKFIALNETKRITFHFPKSNYSYEAINEKET
jgi:hypothetical protein